MVWPCRSRQGNPDGQFFSARCAMKAQEFRRNSVLAYKMVSLACARYAVERERTIACCVSRTAGYDYDRGADSRGSRRWLRNGSPNNASPWPRAAPF